MANQLSVSAVQEAEPDEYEDGTIGNYADGCIRVHGLEVDEVVPIINVENEYFEKYGSLSTGKVEPEDTFDITRVFEENGTIYGEAWVSPNELVQIQTSGNGWGCAFYKNPGHFNREDETTLWTSPAKAVQELKILVEAGLSPAEALDYWMIHIHWHTSTEWAESRGCSQQAVSENFQKASSKLSND